MAHKLGHTLSAAAAAALLLSTASPVTAQFLGRTADDVVQVTLLEGWRMPNGNHMAGLRITLAPGWKTYWRAPGEGGVPTMLSLDESAHVQGTTIHWPSPEVFFTNGMRSIGYQGDVILPVEFELNGDAEMEVSGQVYMGVCYDVCMPIEVDLNGLLPNASERSGAIRTALAAQPLSAHEAGAGDPSCEVRPISDGLQVSVAVRLPDTGPDETLVVEHVDPLVWVSDSQTTREGRMVTGVVDVVPADHRSFILSRSDLRVTVIGARMTVDLGDCAGAP